LFSQAEQIILDEAPCIPLFYDENFRLEQKNVKNLPENPMNHMDMATVYLLPGKKKRG
jgi:peptide/nickel transport system substrate-binding protein